MTIRALTRGFVWMLLLLAWSQAQATVVTSKHNLSVSGPGTITAQTEERICIFCHIPHNASPAAPLWNRRASGGTYIPYSSSTAVASPGQPTGNSVLCLSCHDGTIALGEVLSEPTPIAMAGGVTTMPTTSPGNLGTDLSDDHPVSFVYSSALAAQNGELLDPATLPPQVKLDATGQLQCTSCHDAHEDNFGMFLVMDNSASALCRTCHIPDFWSSSSHSTSLASWNGSGIDPWPNTTGTNVATNACENCHDSHSAGGNERLLQYASEELNCTNCHNGNVATANLEAEFNKLSVHPIGNTEGIHDPTEAAVVDSRHVECADCHDPHAANGLAGTPPGPLVGVRGVDRFGSEVNPITDSHQLCFRCHADSPNKPAERILRQISQTNVRLEFDPTNPSHHAVLGVGNNTNVPSLILPLTVNSTIGCADCHNSDGGPGAGGVGPNGPHGSQYEPILERQYVTLDGTTESSSAYALCYKCHDRNSILGNQSFQEHSKHIQQENTPCSVCHDPHGVSVVQGNSINNSSLINFDLSVVSPDNNGNLRFESTGTFSGSCYLSCHGENHAPLSYP